MKLNERGWHTYPMGLGYQLMTLICIGDGACGVEGNERRRRESEWGKKKERTDEEE
jgi:hypothetical protein